MLTKPKPEQTTISQHECKQRTEAVKRAMQKKKIDAILIFGAGGTSTGNVRYLSNWYSRSIYDQSLLILTAESTPTLFIRLKPYRARQVSWINDIRESGKSGCLELFKDLAQTLEKLGVTDGCIGVVGSFHETWRGLLEYKLRKGFPNAKFVDADEILQTQRLIKSPKEIELMTKSATLVDSAFQALRANLAKGRTDFEVIAESEYIARKNGAEDMLNLIGVSPKGEFVPPISLTHPTGIHLKNGHVVIVELNICYGGYRCEFIRMASFGPPIKYEEEIFEATYTCYKETLRMAKPGITISEAVDAGYKILKEKGFPADRYIPRTHLKTGAVGHGIGLDMFEPPIFNLGNKIFLKPGMTFALHPGLFGALSGDKWGALVGDTVVINETGAKSLIDMKWPIGDFTTI
jgi:Xaa-Pro dipeptidase